MVRAGPLGQLRVATRATPDGLTRGIVDLHGSVVPFLGAAQVNDAPTCCARPDLTFSSDFFGTNSTFIVEAADVFLNSLPQF
jgi:hypothetical protein